MENRRQFSRILFSTAAQLEFAGESYPCKLLDVSLHGALITKCAAFSGTKNSEATLRFTLPQSDIEIKMEVFFCGRQLFLCSYSSIPFSYKYLE